MTGIDELQVVICASRDRIKAGAGDDRDYAIGMLFMASNDLAAQVQAVQERCAKSEWIVCAEVLRVMKEAQVCAKLTPQ